MFRNDLKKTHSLTVPNAPESFVFSFALIKPPSVTLTHLLHDFPSKEKKTLDKRGVLLP